MAHLAPQPQRIRAKALQEALAKRLKLSNPLETNYHKYPTNSKRGPCRMLSLSFLVVPSLMRMMLIHLGLPQLQSRLGAKASKNLPFVDLPYSPASISFSASGVSDMPLKLLLILFAQYFVEQSITLSVCFGDSRFHNLTSFYFLYLL